MTPGHRAALDRRCERLGRVSAFTINEVLVGMSIFMMAIGGVLMCQWFGMIMTESTNSRVTANEKSRRLISQLNAEMSMAKSIRVGTGTVSTFAPIGPALLQSGNAIQINSTTNTNQFIRYYGDTASKSLRRVSDATNTYTTMVTGVVNTALFTMQDFTGTVLTNSQNNCIFSMLLQIHEWQATLKSNSGTNHYTDYNLHTKMAIRTTP